MPLATRSTRVRRLPVMATVALLHLGCYLAVTRINAGRDPASLWSLTTPLDAAIPHLPATWPLYWLTYPFVLLGAGTALWRADPGAWRRGIVALVAVTLIGAAIQLLIPAAAPWPADPAPIQRRYHEGGLVLPYANLPSMHVTYAVMAAGLLREVVRRGVIRWLAPLLAAAITLSTVTLKEHFVLDAAAGLILAIPALLWWRRDAASAHARPPA